MAGAPRARAVAAWVGGVSAAVLFVTGAAVAQGYDAEDLPAIESHVWVARDAAGGQVAAVNTDIAEIASVNDAQGLEGVAQAGSAAFVFGSGFSRFWPLDPARPVDIGTDEALEQADASGTNAPGGTAVESPLGTTDRLAVGEFLLFQGPAPAWARAVELAAEQPRFFELEPYAALGAPAPGARYAATVSTMSHDGVVAMYSTQAFEQRVLAYDTRSGQWTEHAIAAPPTSAAGLQLSFVGDRWVLVAAGTDSRLWVEGREAPIALPGLGGEALLQAPSAPGAAAQHAGRAAIAGSTGLALVDLDDGAIESVEAPGTPARPVAVGEDLAAAWLTQSGGTLWTASGGAVPLVVDGGEFEQNIDVAPTIASNGGRAVLVESTTGMLWSIPDGRLIPLAAWTAGEPPPEAGSVEVPDASSQEPPIAHPDRFGVRAGALVSLPVLLNDSDANASDVLSIDPASVTGLDPGFGTLTLVGSDQSLVVDVAAQSGSATFSYQVTDGTALSAPATVTLSVGDGDAAPVWCGDWVEPACAVPWPAPEVALGGTIRIDALAGWVDPDGDPLVLDSATPEPGAPLVTMPGADGSLAIAHLEDAGGPGQYAVEVVVMDARGVRSAPRELTVTVEAAAGFTVSNGMVLGRSGEWSRVDLADFTDGGSGAFRIADAADISSTLGGLDFEWNPGGATLDLRAAEPGSHLLSVVVVDAATQQQRGLTLRFQAVAPESQTAALPPLTAFVRPGEDTVVDVLGAASNTTDSVLLVTNARSDSGALAATVIDETAIQVRSTDAARSPGPLGTVRLTATTAEGRQLTGSLTVFLVPAASGVQPVALNDTATVRAGEVVEIDVLRNDVAPRGERLGLHPEVAGSGATGELAFAAGGMLRYRAPEVPGTYTVFYHAFLPGSPTLLARAQVTIQVLAPGANRAPQAEDLEARVLAGRSLVIPIDVDALDPDGDRVVVASVTQPARPEHGAVMVGADGRSLLFFAPEVHEGLPATGWQAVVEYTVRDTGGETDTATVRVAVSALDAQEVAPVVFSDRITVPAGTSGPVTIEPLANDHDPAQASLVRSPDRGQGLRIIDLRPNMPGLESDPESPAAAAAALLVPPAGPTTSTESRSPDPYPDGVVAFELAEDTRPGTYVYVYTAESRRTTSTAQALIVLTVTDSPSPDRPVIRDTVVTAADRDLVTGGGIDVLAGRVSWATGDAADLAATLELAPGAPEGFRVRPGTSRIQGVLPEEGAVVPFQVSGLDRLGEPFTTYGFLRIPAFEDLRLSVASPPEPIPEESTGEFDLAEVLAIGEDDVVEVRADGPFTSHRPLSGCELVDGSILSYEAGYFPMFTDTCTIQARLAGQSDAAWSSVVVPIEIEPKDPLAILTPLSLTLSITQPALEVDLYDSLVTWYGGRALDPLSDLAFSWEYAGTQFEVLPRAGSATGVDQLVSIQALGDAVTGTRESIRVRVSYTTVDGFAFDEVVTLVLYVGLAPPEHPTGARLALDCPVTANPSGCQITAVLAQDVNGQFNPLRGAAGDTGLRLVGVGGGTDRTAVCAGIADVRIEGLALAFTWRASDDASKPFGGQCEMPFTVQDAQGRTGQGQIAFTAEGFPQRPATPVTAAYGPDWVDIDVPLGQATAAYPAVSGVRLLDGSSEVANATCARLDAGTHRCRVTGLANGVQHTWQAVTVNAVGESVPTAMRMPTNAYAAPEFTATPVYYARQFDAGVTSPTAGVLLVHEACAAGDAEAIRFVLTDSVQSRTVVKALDASGCVAADSDFGAAPAPGQVQVTAEPLSRFAPPVIGTVAGTNAGGADRQTVTVRGAPVITALTVTPSAGNTEVQLSVAVDARAGDGTQRIAFLAWAPGDAGTTPPTCEADSDGATADDGSAFVDNSFRVVAGTGTARHREGTATSVTIPVDGSATGLVPNLRYAFAACATHGYGTAEQTAAPVWLVQDPGAPTAADMTYTPLANPSNMNSDHLTAPAPAADGPEFVWTIPDGDPTNHAAADFAAQRDAIQVSDPPPPGSAWEVRYSTVATDDVSQYTRTSIDDNASTFYAKFCFTADGQTFCSSRSGPIAPAPGTNAGLDPAATSASVRLPTAAVCVAARDGLNQQVVAAGDAAVAARVADLAAQQGDAAWTSAYNALEQDAEYLALRDPATGWDRPAGTPYDGSYGTIDAGQVSAFLSGVSAAGTDYPGYDAAYQAWLAANPGDTAGAAADGRAKGAVAAERYARGQADAARSAAVTAGTTPGTPEYDANRASAESEGVRVSGFGDVDGEQSRYASLKSSAGQTPALQPVLTGFSQSPFQIGPQITVAADDATRRFGGVHYDVTASVASGANTAYVREAMLTDYPTYTCG